MKNNLDDKSMKGSEVTVWLDSKENIEVLDMKSLSLKVHNKQDAKVKNLPNALIENVFKLKNEKISLAPPFLPPQAYHYKDIYSIRKDQRIQRYIEQERKQREFHSQPMPNFRQVHERQALRTVVHRITMPVTPNVLRNSQGMDLKRRQREEQLLRQRQEEAKLQRQQQSLRAKPIPEMKRRELKEQRQQAEREANQRQRQLTTFRARPNPFASTAR
ncbi:hypothetical protein KR032_003934 [Drosophila birchii]|nr:hypothetical protein KR032_003934 [Drosophila birchii]